MASIADENPRPATTRLPIQHTSAPLEDPDLDLDPSEEDTQSVLDDAAAEDNAEALGAPVPDKSGFTTIAGKSQRDLKERLDRHLADEKLVQQLRCGDFTGPRYDYFANDLSSYGLTVTRAWLATGHAFALLRERGYPLKATDEELEAFAHDLDARNEVATMTVAVALSSFRERALVRGGWDSTKGASLTTYFMGACILALANVLRERRRRTKRWGLQNAKDAVTYDTEQRGIDIAADVVGRASLRHALSQYKPRERRIIAASLLGFSQEEIAETFDGDSSARAVEAVLHRWRTKEKKLALEGGVRF